MEITIPLKFNNRETIIKFCIFVHGDVSEYDVITPAMNMVDQFR